ncbi:growth/differentiation factor 6-A [Ictalurus punctatus]|uniref:Growth/differentiation factor 6-A n=1 Tax=Ictalurus punctatus TaxID=7998 RepID=A0A2D0RPR7_ICTPU|nr:growth/differentiation factor 6-A [Ictalurus punctatus]
MSGRKTGAPLLWLAVCFGSALESVALGPRAVWRNGSAVLVPDYMLNLYRTQSQLGRTSSYGSATRARRRANTVTSFVDQSKDEPSAESHQQYIFDLSGLSRTEELVEAELRVLRKLPSDLEKLQSCAGNLYHLHLYSCSSRGSSGKPLLLTSRTINILDTTLSTWDVFNLGTTLRAHHKVHRRTQDSRYVCFSIAVVSDLTDEVVSPSLIGLGSEGQQKNERALLVAFSRTRRKENLFREIREKMKAMHMFDQSAEGHGRPRHRQKRRTVLAGRSGGAGTAGGGGAIGGGGTGGGGKGGGRRRTRCSRKPLHVNFKELGWDDWIIAPLDYDAYHCEGACDFPLRSHLEPTNHAIIQTLMNSMDPESTPPSCCVPSKLSPISILYIDAGNNVVYKQYEDMVVESCGCR